jgi:DNA-directed RNA polymerase specialized sigma24 family protein
VLLHPVDVGNSRVSDAELVTLATMGEAEALAVLLERYRPSLYAAAIRLLRNRDDALDAVQETCVVALVRLGLLRDPQAVGGWLHSVLRNACLMRLRGDRHELPLQRARSQRWHRDPRTSLKPMPCATGCGPHSTHSARMTG